MTSFWRIIKYAFQDMGRNIGLSFMTVFILILMLLSVNMLWSVRILTEQAVTLVKNQVNVNINFKPTVKAKEVNDITNFVKAFPEVTGVASLSSDDVLKAFKERRPETASALQELGTNPFGPSIIIKTREPDDYKKIIDALSVPEYNSIIEDHSFGGNEDALLHLQLIMNRVQTAVLGLAIVFALISFLVIFNTIRVGIYTQRQEINIKRLVGANNWFIRGPYVLESIVFTLLSVALTGVVLWFAFQKIDPYLSGVFGSGFTLTNYYTSHILYLSLIQVSAVLLLTIISSSLAMRKHLRA
jgi:cell division transport system permease protein